MKLFKENIVKNDKTYINLYLVWLYEGKTYKVRVKPSFYSDIDKLCGQAVELPQDEPVEKYI